MDRKVLFFIICALLIPFCALNAKASFPEPPEIVSEGAVLMDAKSGIILYEKNAHERLYPASTTKILTTLIAAENAALTDTVTFSETAVNSVPADGSKIGMDAGETLTMEQCIYAILVGSANEVSNAVAEHISGSIPAFVDRMNETAAALGCENSHFMNTNGLHDDDHYTSAYDLATIGRAFFDNDLLCTASGTARYHFEPTETQPDDIYITNKHKLVNGVMPYEGIIGGKTGYTSNAMETLVTCAEVNGMKLIAAVLKAPSPDQFNDTVALFDYGFKNYYRIAAGSDVLPEAGSCYGSGETYFDLPLYSLNADASGAVILPNDITLEDCTVTVTYPENATSGSDRPAATLVYTAAGREVGYVDILLNRVTESVGVTKAAVPDTLYINIFHILFVIGGFALLAVMIIVFRTLIYGRVTADSTRLSFRRRREIKRRRGY